MASLCKVSLRYDPDTGALQAYNIETGATILEISTTEIKYYVPLSDQTTTTTAGA